MSDYYSKKKCGVDTKEFFRNFGETMTESSRNGGWSRHSLSGFVIGKSRKPQAKNVLEYLEGRTLCGYEDTIRDCIKRLHKVNLNRKRAWTEYLEREKTLSKIREKYDMKREQTLLEQRSGKSIFYEMQ